MGGRDSEKLDFTVLGPILNAAYADGMKPSDPVPLVCNESHWAGSQTDRRVSHVPSLLRGFQVRRDGYRYYWIVSLDNVVGSFKVV